MLDMKICNVRTYVTHEYKMFSVRTYLHRKYLYIRTYVTHENTMSGVRTYITSEDV